jgi:hypothetical protein
VKEKKRDQPDAAKLKFIGVQFLNMFQASIMPVTGVQD